MDENEWLASRFEEQRTHLRAVAYRMLGSLSEADDALQDTWLRVSRAEVSEVENFGGWLTTIVARICLNMLRTRKVRREEPLEAYVPDPIICLAGELQPEEEALLADSVGLALLVVLDALAPAERLAFVLHDMFELPFDEIAPIVGRSPAAARQLASRARSVVYRVPTYRTPTPSVNAPWSTHSSWPLGTATSTPSLRCCILMWCCEPTTVPAVQKRPSSSGAPPPWSGKLAWVQIRRRRYAPHW